MVPPVFKTSSLGSRALCEVTLLAKSRCFHDSRLRWMMLWELGVGTQWALNDRRARSDCQATLHTSWWPVILRATSSDTVPVRDSKPLFDRLENARRPMRTPPEWCLRLAPRKYGLGTHHDSDEGVTVETAL